MCGIAGAFSFQSELSSCDFDVVQRLSDRQRLRGPDGEGRRISRDKRVALGHRRLAIIDVSSSGKQPMCDVTGRWTITFNGEIYNYRELREDLRGVGRKFKTESDTEVLISAIAEWGEDGLRKLRGMFAFALWDDEKKELWLARDPFGIKPLFYADTGPTLWFASQARALSECAPVNTKRSPAGSVGFYLWGAVPDPFTWWKGISALPAGHLLRVMPGKGPQSPKSFLAIEHLYNAASAQPLLPQQLKAALVDSIAHHYVADVPVGVFLSAGVDSTALATLAKESGFKLNTVTLAFDEFKGTDLDEAPTAEETARLLSADHNTLRISKDVFLEIFDDFLASMDQPTTDGLNTYLVSRAAASAGLKVVLSGLGGDEIFGGYPSFRQVPRLVSIGRCIRGRSSLGYALDRIARPVARMLNLSPKFAAALKYSNDIEAAFCLRRCLYLPEEIELMMEKSWVGSGMEELSGQARGGSADNLKGLSPHAAVSQLEITRYMRMQPLRDTDWASMAHSLEVRLPLLDLPLFEKLAPAIASTRPPTKSDFARAAGDVALRLERRPKSGFATPVAQWLNNSAQPQRGLKTLADRVAAAFTVAE